LLGEALKVLSKGTGIPAKTLNHFWIVSDTAKVLERHSFHGEKGQLDDIPTFDVKPDGVWDDVLGIVDNFIQEDGPWSEYRDNTATLHYIVNRFTANNK
jgi:hypothetical protein